MTTALFGALGGAAVVLLGRIFSVLLDIRTELRLANARGSR